MPRPRRRRTGQRLSPDRRGQTRASWTLRVAAAQDRVHAGEDKARRRVIRAADVRVVRGQFGRVCVCLMLELAARGRGNRREIGRSDGGVLVVRRMGSLARSLRTILIRCVRGMSGKIVLPSGEGKSFVLARGEHGATSGRWSDEGGEMGRGGACEKQARRLGQWWSVRGRTAAQAGRGPRRRRRGAGEHRRSQEARRRGCPPGGRRNRTLCRGGASPRGPRCGRRCRRARWPACWKARLPGSTPRPSETALGGVLGAASRTGRRAMRAVLRQSTPAASPARVDPPRETTTRTTKAPCRPWRTKPSR
jgi:hypothetical protein